jgi:type II secretory pathway pseudopilin PulG
MVELMVALVMFSMVMTATISLMRSQTRTFRISGERMELSQNMRYAVGTIDRVLRTTGMGVVSQQPMFVYGGNDVVAFNSNHTHINNDNCAVNINPDAPAGSYEILPQASAFTLPNTAFNYPAMTYAPGPSPCRAETIVFYFRPDSSTVDVPNDFVLMQKVNAMPAELVAKNLMAYPGRPFFQYIVHPRSLVVPPAARDSNVIAGVAGGPALPIVHSAPVHGSPADSALDPSNSYLADSVKAVRISIRVSNGLTGAEQRVKDVSTVVSLPNNGLAQLRDCGSTPLLNGNFLALPNLAGNPPSVTLQWDASFDEAAGETDINQYNLYRREVAGPAFGSAWQTIPAGQPSPYVFVDDGVDVGVQYQYAVGAQDCTPLESVRLVSGVVVPIN